jgi:hypothetical protein
MRIDDFPALSHNWEGNMISSWWQKIALVLQLSILSVVLALMPYLIVWPAIFVGDWEVFQAVHRTYAGILFSVLCGAPAVIVAGFVLVSATGLGAPSHDRLTVRIAALLTAVGGLVAGIDGVIPFLKWMRLF